MSLPQRRWLKAPDRATLWAALVAAGIVAGDDEGRSDYGGREFDLHFIGAIFRPTGAKIVNADGETVDVMADVGGYHANLQVHDWRDLSALDAVSIDEPQLKSVVFC